MPPKKEPYPALVKLCIATKFIALVATIAVAVYYGHFAPEGTWAKLVESNDAQHGPSSAQSPRGLPLNPQFTSTMLASWDVYYVAANPQYRAEQGKWRGQKVTLLEKPGREVTEVVDLTIGFGQGNELLDIHLSGACQAITDDRVAYISKNCVGWWKDRGGQISGQFYLEVTEGGGGRDFDAYLYPGNHLPGERNLYALLFSRPPIPAIRLQFRPKGSRDQQ